MWLNEIMEDGEYVEIWEKSVVAYFRVLSSSLCGETQENHKQKTKTKMKRQDSQ
jgi:hypothetical protein